VEPAAFAALADSLTAELKRLGWWPDGLGDDEPPAEVSGPFGQPDMPFVHWVARVLVPRLRQVARGESDPPGSSMVAAQAVRELDGVTEAADLIALLQQVDDVIAAG
jgi:uncharacterized protein YqcC (DUF446 family)